MHHNRTVFNSLKANSSASSNESAQDVDSRTVRELLDTDRTHVWHPYSPLPGVPHHLVTDAQGVYLTLTRPQPGGDYTSQRVIDGMSSWWAAAFGYRHPQLDAAARTQLEHFSHVMFGGLTHEPAIRLAQQLVSLTPDPLEKVFFCDSGSVSVEVAVKMALQYWRSQSDEKLHSKRRLLTWRGGYHGDTFTPMSVCDPEGGMHSLWAGVVWPQVFLPLPPADPATRVYASPTSHGVPSNQAQTPETSTAESLGLSIESYLAQAEEIVSAHSDELAACIIEPVVQGAGGMRFHAPELVAGLTDICRRHNVLVIFDEIATGFGRTGTFFAADACECSPDIMCIGKALTGGYLTSAAVLTTDHIATTISDGNGALMHGPTFMGNPLAAAIGVQACELAREADNKGRARHIEQELRRGLTSAAALPGVHEVRVKGAIGVIDMEEPVDVVTATAAALKEGVWIRPFRNLLYIMPPLISTDDEIATICRALYAAAQAVTASAEEDEGDTSSRCEELMEEHS